MHSLGINVGSSNIKAVLLEGDSIVWSAVEPHEGNFLDTLKKILLSRSIPANVKTLATGTEGRHLLNVNSVIEPLCIEEALRKLDSSADALVSLGGEDLVVYTLDKGNKIITSFSGNKCASGTGEFFKQQLARMNMTLANIQSIPEDSRVLKLSSRCSVFMKSDCTHRLNKGEAKTGDIVLSLSDVMAVKVIDFLKRARIEKGKVLLAGGVTQNPYILRFIRERMPDIAFIVPEQAPYFEAYGAALMARTSGSKLPAVSALFKSSRIQFKRFKSLKTAEGRVTYLPSQKGKVVAGREYILGVDGGSTTTKACLIDMETREVTASFYGRTHGDPVSALKNCLVEMKKQIRDDIGDEKIRITLASTTGSSREILGVFLETPAVYNEIIAHAVGTTFYRDDIDTIFEIGGQDAKYVSLKNKVPIDYAMNEACSAGTGSFLEESAQGDLNIPEASQIGDIALAAEAPLKFGEHCSAFINSDIRNAVQQGASREDITAGIVTSIVSNYLNRVVGNRTIGKNIVLQGGVAKNKAVPLAFAMLLDKNVLVPPDPELMGCFGVGVLAKQKFDEGFLTKTTYDLDQIL
ncbi:MAG: acyl-CoA dehydratase activase, partial [Smithellaceae bacterium]